MPKILMLDDHSDLFEILEMILFHRGHEVIGDVLFLDALNVVVKRKPDLILLNCLSNNIKLDVSLYIFLNDNHVTSIPTIILLPEKDVSKEFFSQNRTPYFLYGCQSVKAVVCAVDHLLSAIPI